MTARFNLQDINEKLLEKLRTGSRCRILFDIEVDDRSETGFGNGVGGVIHGYRVESVDEYGESTLEELESELFGRTQTHGTHG